MRRCLALLLLAGLLACARAGSGIDRWGQDTLTNYPAGRGRLTVPVQANDDGSPQPIDLPCQCSDADPRDEVSQLVTFSCFYQRLFGNCNETFMFDANAELAPEGFCQISCSRCNCCEPPVGVLRELQASRFLQALEAAQRSLKDALSHPGYTNTILVPTDAAWDAALAKYGTQLTNPAVLQQVLKFHILPPEPTRRGLWTTPFMSLGPKMYTLYDGPAALSVKRFPLPANVTWKGGLTGFQISSPINSATVLQSDVMACKSPLTVIDAVLLPFDPAALPSEDWLQPAKAVGVEGCFVAPNGLITGDVLRDGRANPQASVGACCDSCKSSPGCTGWTYCAQKGGCRTADGTLYEAGFCELKRSPIVNGQANYADYSFLTVPFISGYVAAAAAPQGEPQVAALGGGL